MDRLATYLRSTAGDRRGDGDLLAAFLAERDEPAFAELVRRHGPLVWGTCRRALANPADAEDAFQATFLVLVRRAGHLSRTDALGPWLHRVAVWTARSLRRKNARRRFGELIHDVADSRVAEPAFDLDGLLIRLPEKYRSAIVLCHLQGLSYREAAARLGCAEGTVSSLVSRGLAKLRARLGVEPAALLALAATGSVPLELSAAAVRSAIAFDLSAAASPAVVHLAKGVLRMFWMKKLTAAGSLAAVGLAALLGVALTHTEPAVAAEKPAAAIVGPVAAIEGFIEIRISAVPGDALYRVEEIGANGQSVAVIRCEDAKGLSLFLARTAKDPAAPKAVRLVVWDGATNGTVFEAARACATAGHKHVRYYGCLPPGCGLRTGEGGKVTRYDGAEFETNQLWQMLHAKLFTC